MAKPRQTLFARGSAKGRRTDAGAIQGLVVSNLQETMQRVARVNAEAAEEVGELILKNTLPKTPMDTGALRESGRVMLAKSRRGNPTVEVTFGSGSVDYAVFVHEDMPRGIDKRYTTSGTGPKYLQQGAAESIDEIRSLLIRKLSTVTNEGSGGRGGRGR